MSFNSQPTLHNVSLSLYSYLTNFIFILYFLCYFFITAVNVKLFSRYTSVAL